MFVCFIPDCPQFSGAVHVSSIIFNGANRIGSNKEVAMNTFLVLVAFSTPLNLPSDAQFVPTPLRSTETACASYPTGFQDEKEAEWTKYGMLDKTDMKCEDGQPIYTLKYGNKLIAYVATKKGKNLSNYIGSFISVYGPTVNSPNKKLRYVLGSHVAVGDPVVQVKTRSFAVPLVLDEKQKEEAEAVRLLVSEDRGKSWKLVKECKLSDKQVEFHAKRDDLYLFACQAVDKDGKTSPETEAELVPVVRFNVDTAGRIREVENSDSDLRQEVERLRNTLERLERRVKELESERKPK